MLSFLCVLGPGVQVVPGQEVLENTCNEYVGIYEKGTPLALTAPISTNAKQRVTCHCHEHHRRHYSWLGRLGFWGQCQVILIRIQMLTVFNS